MEQLLLKDICTFANGKAHEQYVDENGEYILVTSKFIASDGESYRRTSDRLTPLEVGDLCMVMSDVPKGRALAKCFLVDKNDIYTLNQRIGVFKADDRYIKKYFYYMLNRNRYFLSFDDGDSQTNLRKDDILNCPVICPSKEEQLEVIKILDGVALVIRQRKEQLKYLDDLIKARFVELFVGKDYPLIELDDLSIGKGEYGAQSASTEYDPNRPRYVRITDINDDGTLNGDVVSSANIEDDEQYKLTYGDFLFARMGATVGKTYAYKSGNQIFAGYLIRYRLNLEKIMPEYLYAYTRLDEYKNWVLLNQSGAAQPGINAKKYASLQIPVAPLAEQMAFEDFVKQVDKSKVAVQKALAETQVLFDSLMQQYFG